MKLTIEMEPKESEGAVHLISTLLMIARDARREWRELAERAITEAATLFGSSMKKAPELTTAVYRAPDLRHNRVDSSFRYHCRCGEGFKDLNSHEGFRAHILSGNKRDGMGQHGKVRE